MGTRLYPLPRRRWRCDKNLIPIEFEYEDEFFFTEMGMK